MAKITLARKRLNYMYPIHMTAIYRKTSNKHPGGNKFQTRLRPGCYWRQAFIRGI